MKRFLPFLLLFVFHSISAQSFMYLNAVDFDFTTNKAGYTGHFNIYSPPTSSSKWGYNAGVMKINYSTSDSTMQYREDYVKLQPLDQLTIGSKYEAKYNEYKIKTRNSSYSIYMQALYALRNPDGNSSKIFAHAHGELLIANFEISQTINTLQRDTVTVKSLDSIPERILSFQNNKNDGKSKSITGYFGFGATFDLKCTQKARLFFQPTIGVTTNYPQPSSVNTDGNVRSYYQSDIKEWNAFYLVRSYFRYILSEKTGAGAGGAETASSELILGTDIRGLFPKYAPFYSVYIGLNLDLSKLTDLFKAEK